MKDRLAILAGIGLSLLVASCADHSGRSSGSGPISLQPEFESRIELATGTSMHSDAALGDFDGDGDQDLVVIGLAGQIQVMLGANNATFAPGQTIENLGEAIAMRAADFDDDLDLDIVVLRVDAEVADVYLNDGSANFTLGDSLAIGAEPVSVLTGDFDNNGMTDIVVSRVPSPEIQFFYNTPTGFIPGTGLAMPGGGSPLQLGFGDVTHDGPGDLIVCDQNSARVLVYPGSRGPDGFGLDPLQIFVNQGPKAVSVGDLSGDGQPDMAISAYGAHRIVVLTDISDPANPSEIVLDGVGTPTISIIEDLTGDGLVDLVACLELRAAITVFPQLPGGGLGEAMQMDATGLPLRPMAGDVNGDQHADLVVLAGLGDRLSIFLGRGDGDLIGSKTYDTELADADFLSGGDFDNDGVDEVVVGGGDSTEVAIMTAEPRANGGARLEVALTIDVGRSIYNVHGADVDADGRTDIVVAVAGGVKILHNILDAQSTTRFEFEVLPPDPSQVYAGGDGPFGVEVADMNADGRLDLVVADFQGERLYLLLATAQPFEFEPTPTVIDISGGPVDVAVADFSGDGVLDVAVSRFDLSIISLLYNDGAGNLQLGMNLPVQAAPNYLITEDFDSDGRADLVVSNAGSASISVLFATDQGFATASFSAGQAPTALLGRDLTDDGIPDILVASLVGADFRVLVGDGAGGFPAVFGFPGTLGASAARLQDTDGDLRPDLLLGSLISTRVSLYRNISK